MTSSLLKIKINPPQLREELVPRPQLIERLNQSLERRFTLISAPAGFGKTTLIGMWLKESQHAAAWYSLEDSDNEPIRFLAYLVAALQNINPDLGDQTQAQLKQAQLPPFDQLLTVLLNEILEYPEELIIVLDDYHHIHSSVIQEGLNFLLGHIPHNVHLIVATRSDPALPIGRLRGLGQLVELRTAQLRFSSEEVVDFLNGLMMLDLDSQQIGLLEKQTEGWVSGLQLAALSLQGKNREGTSAFITSFSGTHRYILDYLLEEVMLQQPPEIQRFMLQTSILTRLNASLCEAVTGQTSSQAFLEDLETRNLFIFPLDNERCWYRFHALFADLLQKYLRQSGIDQVQELHLKASYWHQKYGTINDAIDHAFLAGQPDRAADLIEFNTMDGFAQGAFYAFQYWLKQLPDELIDQRPLLCIVAAWTEIWTNNHSVRLGDEWMERAEAALSGIDSDVKPAWYNIQTNERTLNLTIRQIVESYQAAYRALSVGLRGSPDQSWIEKANDALKIIPDELPVLRGLVFAQLGISQMTIGNMQAAMKAFNQAQHLGRRGGNAYGALLAGYIQAGIVRLKGELHQAETLLGQAIEAEVTTDNHISHQPPIMGAIYAALGDILRERGEFKSAQPLLERGMAVCKPAALGELGIGTNQTIEEEGYVLAAVSLAKLRYALGEPIQNTSIDTLAERCSPGLKRFVRLHQVRLWLTDPDLTQEGLDKAVLWAESQELNVVAPTWDWDNEIPTLLTTIRVRLAQSRRGSITPDYPEWHKILQILDAQEQVCLEREWIERVIEIQILKAMALQLSGQIDAALEVLGKAMIKAGEKGYRRLFLDEGHPILTLIYQALERNIAPDTARTLISSSKKEPSSIRSEKSSGSLTDLPLTRREVEILELIAAGLTNAEIGQELSIAMGTVKRHTANINLKLDTHNRTQSVARAREIGILAQD